MNNAVAAFLRPSRDGTKKTQAEVAKEWNINTSSFGRAVAEVLFHLL
jgi:hypothetical protein